MTELYLPDDTITKAERVTLEYLREQMIAEDESFPVEACAATAYLVEQVLGWPLVAVECHLQQTITGIPRRHAANTLPDGTFVDLTLSQFNPDKYRPVNGLCLTKRIELHAYLGAPDIAIIPSDTPIFSLDEPGSNLLRSSPPSESVSNILYRLGMYGRMLHLSRKVIWR